MVTQETHLFHDTIRTNLLCARPNATQAELEAAAQAANIHGFVCDLPIPASSTGHSPSPTPPSAWPAQSACYRPTVRGGNPSAR
jgi:hypothetical protein